MISPELQQLGKRFQILFDAIVSGKLPVAMAIVPSRARSTRDGKVASPEGIKLSEADLIPQPYQFVVAGMGSSVRAGSERSRELGWNEGVFASKSEPESIVCRSRTDGRAQRKLWAFLV